MEQNIFRKTLEPFPQGKEILLKNEFYKIKNDKPVTLAVTKNKIFILYNRGTLKFAQIEFDLRFQLRSEIKQANQQIFILVFEKDDCPTIEFYCQNSAILNWRLLLKDKLNMIDYQYFYQMSRLIGQGGFASCYLALRKGDHEQFAAKAFFKKLLYQQDAKSKVKLYNQLNQQSIQNEISIMREISDHCYIMKLFEVFENKAQIYLILELAEGGTLQKFLNSNKKGLPLTYALTVFKQLLLAVYYMHNKGIMHRDIKPSNILFRKSPPTKAYILEHDSSASIVLSDFGISTRKELAFDEAGTSGYMGPEVYHDNRKPDEGYNYQCDVFSLGCVLFEMLKGYRLFKGNSQKELYASNKGYIFDSLEVGGIPHVGNLLLMMLDRRSEKRPTVNQILLMISDKNDEVKRPQSSPRKKKLDNTLMDAKPEQKKERKVSCQFEIMEPIQEHQAEESPLLQQKQMPSKPQLERIQLKPLRMNKHQVTQQPQQQHQIRIKTKPTLSKSQDTTMTFRIIYFVVFFLQNIRPRKELTLWLKYSDNILNQMDQELSVNLNRLAVIIIGMAGTGKTTFVSQLSKYLNAQKKQHFIINLDPAVYNIPYTPNVDIRKSINYKELMTKNQLGPNGAIMTALNLYCLQINTLFTQIDVLPKEQEIVLIDTPGQIEAFTWSSSGSIISQSFASTMPTVLFYVMDIARCQNPNSFMSNLLFCCSIFYKMKLPMVLIFNKVDVASAKEPLEWIRDYDKFVEACKSRDTYLTTLSKQMALTFEEFYENFKIVEVSSLTGEGFEKIEESLSKAKEEYLTITLPDLHQQIKEKKNKSQEIALQQLEKFKKQQMEDQKMQNE